ncbi:RHS repeat-associated core domain-containing protein [Pseudomonas syringae]|uniref:RHS repeat-associated core domain-containing protein n=1 Tax=Pseudomonas syringae TaxID=317 RepID=UPI0009B539C8|nr:RHS repeat-associated core domain-containing protein [Pseudomonas syringae]
MASTSQVVLCRYRYDPLDRLAGTAPLGQADALRFYQKNRLATEIQGAVLRTIVQHEDLLLAQQQRFESVIETALLATDQQRSVLQLLDNTGTRSLVYSPYGHLPADSGLTSLLGFNGEHRDPVTGHYLLGNGYRAFNPVLMRFNSPDSLSPFGEGGINAYAYCAGDPVNFADPTGHSPWSVFTTTFKFVQRLKAKTRLTLWKRVEVGDHASALKYVSFGTGAHSAPQARLVSNASTSTAGPSVVAGTSSSVSASQPSHVILPPAEVGRLQSAVRNTLNREVTKQPVSDYFGKAISTYKTLKRHSQRVTKLRDHFHGKFAATGSPHNMNQFRSYRNHTAQANSDLERYLNELSEKFGRHSGPGKPD